MMVPLIKSFSIQVNGLPRRRGKQDKENMDGSSKEQRIELMKCSLTEDLAQNRSEWRNIINVADHNRVGT